MPGGQQWTIVSASEIFGDMATNVIGTGLQGCSAAPLTGFYRDGWCLTGEGDIGVHAVCAEVTAEFLSFTAGRGNDLSTARPEFQFPGLKPGDRWCLCAPRWQEALDAGVAPPIGTPISQCRITGRYLTEDCISCIYSLSKIQTLLYRGFYMNSSTQYRPYIFGALAGLLQIASVAVAGQFFGTSTTFPRTAGMIINSLGFDVSQVQLGSFADGPAVLLTHWQTWFVIGIGIGAFLMSKATGTFKRERLPQMWTERFGPSMRKRFGLSMLGGIIAIMGVRMAGGCPSGHGVSGLAQLGVSSLIAVSMFFVGGIITARLIYGRASA